MNSRQRVLAAIAHQIPDRIPVGEWGIDHDHVARIIGHPTYWRNRRETTLALWANRRGEVVDSMKADYSEIIETLDYDLVPVDLVAAKSHRCDDPPALISPGTWQDTTGKTYRYCASNDSISCVTPPPARDTVSPQMLDSLVRSLHEFDDTQFEIVDYIAERFGKDRAIVFRGLSVMQPLFEPFGGDMQHHLMLTALAPEELKKLSDYVIEYNRILIEHCSHKNITIIMIGDDYGCNHGCLFSPVVFRSVFLPILRQIVAMIKAKGMIPFFHCCGKIWEILDDFVGAGWMGYQSIQATAGMDLRKVKELYGDQLTLWGGVQCETLCEGSIEEVQREVINALKVGLPGGGFIFGSTNSVQFGAKTENYLRALDIVRATPPGI
jgi:hypothetical protein